VRKGATLRTIITSDFHLSFSPNDQDKIERAGRVLLFLESLRGNTDLLILAGDVFDLWYDWSNTLIKGYFPVLKKFADLREAGCRIVLIAGNHDFWFGNFFPEHLGIEVYPEDFTETIDGKRVFVTHGDKQTVNDLRYKIFRWFIRLPISKRIFSIIHPEISLRLGIMLSRTSRARNVSSNKGSDIRGMGLERFAERNSKRYDLIAMGHSHKPVTKTFGNCEYFNTGDWITHNSYVEMIDGKAELKFFDEN